MDQIYFEQAAVKFEVNRKTVKHWLDRVEGKAATAIDQAQFGTAMLPKKKVSTIGRSIHGKSGGAAGSGVFPGASAIGS